MTFDKKNFIRELFTNIFIDNDINQECKSGTLDLFLNSDKRHSRQDPHDGFWYCVDICWDKFNEIDLVISLYQSFFYDNPLKENKEFENKIRSLIISYSIDNCPDFFEKLKKYDHVHGTDLLNDRTGWTG